MLEEGEEDGLSESTVGLLDKLGEPDGEDEGLEDGALLDSEGEAEGAALGACESAVGAPDGGLVGA